MLVDIDIPALATALEHVISGLSARLSSQARRKNPNFSAVGFGSSASYTSRELLNTPPSQLTRAEAQGVHVAENA